MKIHKVTGNKPFRESDATQTIKGFMLVLKDVIGDPDIVVTDNASLQYSSTSGVPALKAQHLTSPPGLTNGHGYSGFSQYAYGTAACYCVQYDRSASTEGNMSLYYTKIKNGVLFCVTGDNTATSQFSYEDMSNALIKNTNGHLIHICSMPVSNPSYSDTLSQVCVLDITSGAWKYATSDFNQYLISEGKAAENIFGASLAPFYVPDLGAIDGAYLPVVLPKKQDKMFVFTLGDKEYISMAGFSGTQIPVFECAED